MHERSLLRKLLLLLLLFAVMASTVYFFADRYYRDRNRQLYEPKLRWIDAMLSDEKQWIRQRQGESGELYVHEIQPGNINPYFACHAAMGLLESTDTCPVTREDLDAVQCYLNWHTGMVMEEKGILRNYRRKDGQLIRTGNT